MAAPVTSAASLGLCIRRGMLIIAAVVKAWDVAVFVTLVVAFASFVTAHLALSVGLVARTPRWRGVVALLVPPLAPFWGYESGLRRWSAAWVLAFVLYAVALMLAAL